MPSKEITDMDMRKTNHCIGLASVGLQTQLWVSDNTNQTTGVGGGISFAGKYITSNAAQITFGAIRGSKVNTTSADTLGHLELYHQLNLNKGRAFLFGLYFQQLLY